MAKRSNSQFNKVLATIPSEATFEIDMVADSTNEAWVDIDTNLSDGEAWLIYGCEWTFEVIADPRAPLAPSTALIARTFQLHRTDDSEVLLQANDDQVIVHHVHNAALAGAAGLHNYNYPYRVAKRTVTMQPTLRALFRTSADDGGISDPLNHLVGKIFYDKVAAPDIGTSKLGVFAAL